MTFALLVLLFVSTTSTQGVRLMVTPSGNPVQKPVGSDVQLICRLEEALDDKAGLIWTKHGGIHKTGNVEVKKLDPYNIVLTIRNGTVRDGGIYTCTGTVYTLTLKADIDIIFFSELRFLHQNNHATDILATASVNISCSVQKEMGEKVATTWYKHASVIQPQAGKAVFHDDGAILEIKNYDPASDPGEYTCRVENEQTGNSIVRTVLLGGIVETRKAFCNAMCTSVCNNIYNPHFSHGMF